MDPFTGMNVEDDGEPLSPARTIISVGANALICPRAEANIAPVFVAEKPSKKMVVMLQSAPDSTRIQRTGRVDLPTPLTFHLMDFQNRYPIINVAPHCVAIERLHVAISQ
jgi:hypothetical protein